MRQHHPTPTPEPLPFDHMYSGMQARRYADEIPLAEAAVARFDQLLHEIHADAPRVNADRMQQLAAWLLKLPADHAHDVIDSRLQRVHELRLMLADEDWDSDAATRARIGQLLAYIDREDDLIADHTPVLGQLDDVLMIELAWPAFADDVEDYRDYCEYRRIEHPAGPPPARRAAWVRDRLDELALWQHMLWVREQHYAPWNLPAQLFRVS
ncbi:hypothetical protein HIV01_007550 [Lysobacter arenosi]|uniref:DUF1232 domain-containing protein n=1 Tax=Lysobacter arenosi TaxID=2795387 RepID=A0ABX7RDT9_9GAMM|nr:hypothetical protein [Lysobacter arenosi]QSX76325.1 hypothetical protein HIV01_007550 [Lysobacter arenosi]